MTEQEWLECDDPHPMLARLRRRKRLDRKLLLFGCACWRRVIPLMAAKRAIPGTFRAPKSRSDLAVAITSLERYADGGTNPRQFLRTWPYLTLNLARHLGVPFKGKDATPWQVAQWASIASGWWAFNYSPGPQSAMEAARRMERTAQAPLLRHIFGTFGRSSTVAEQWPATVTKLANALYNGENCGFALQDALLEAGHPELADHFREEQSHPKGCWVLDAVLGRA